MQAINAEKSTILASYM